MNFGAVRAKDNEKFEIQNAKLKMAAAEIMKNSKLKIQNDCDCEPARVGHFAFLIFNF